MSEKSGKTELKISDLEEMLKRAKERMGDVVVKGWDKSKGVSTFNITGINYEGDHIELN